MPGPEKRVIPTRKRLKTRLTSGKKNGRRSKLRRLARYVHDLRQFIALSPLFFLPSFVFSHLPSNTPVSILAYMTHSDNVRLPTNSTSQGSYCLHSNKSTSKKRFEKSLMERNLNLVLYFGNRARLYITFGVPCSCLTFSRHFLFLSVSVVLSFLSLKQACFVYAPGNHRFLPFLCIIRCGGQL